MKRHVRKGMAVAACAAVFLSMAAGCKPTEETPSDNSETSQGGVAVMETVKLENDQMSMSLNVKDGLAVTSIYDKLNDNECLPKDHPLFKYNITTNLEIGGYESKGTFDSQTDVYVNSATLSENGKTLTVETTPATHEGLVFVAVVDASTDEITVQLTVKNNSDAAIYARMNYPQYVSLNAPGSSADSMAMIPSEIGWVGPYGQGHSYGNGFNDQTGLPTGYNVMQVAAIYNSKGLGGIYFYDQTGDEMSGNPPVHMQIGNKQVTGHWGKQIEAKAEATSPIVAMGVIPQDNDWHYAIDAYMEHQDDLLQNELGIPAWLSEAGAVYSARREGTGGTYQTMPETGDLSTRIDSFYDMDQLLDEAEDFGTNVIALIDFYEKANPERVSPTLREEVDSMPYWNKGDYIPREDLGGEEAFKAGIQKVHDRGGRVFVYVEPFILFQYSELAAEVGSSWAARLPDGKIDTSYALCYTMIPAYKEWQDYVVETCKRLVEEYGVDGIFLDSLGWQWNHWFYVNAEKHIYSLEEWNQGFITLVQRIRETIREIKPDAVVLSESAGGPLPAYNDGGWAAQNTWGDTAQTGAIWASPVRYAYSSAEVNFITNGNDLNGLNQVFAAGFSLALSDYWDDNKAYISQLVNIRKEYKDALVYGKQAYQPTTATTDVIAYCYEGTDNMLIPIVNSSDAAYSGAVALNADQAGQTFTDLLTGETYTAGADGVVYVPLDGQSLAVLQRTL